MQCPVIDTNSWGLWERQETPNSDGEAYTQLQNKESVHSVRMKVKSYPGHVGQGQAYGSLSIFMRPFCGSKNHEIALSHRDDVDSFLIRSDECVELKNINFSRSSGSPNQGQITINDNTQDDQPGIHLWTESMMRFDFLNGSLRLNVFNRDWEAGTIDPGPVFDIGASSMMGYLRDFRVGIGGNINLSCSHKINLSCGGSEGITLSSPGNYFALPSWGLQYSGSCMNLNSGYINLYTGHLNVGIGSLGMSLGALDIWGVGRAYMSTDDYHINGSTGSAIRMFGAQMNISAKYNGFDNGTYEWMSDKKIPSVNIESEKIICLSAIPAIEDDDGLISIKVGNAAGASTVNIVKSGEDGMSFKDTEDNVLAIFSATGFGLPVVQTLASLVDGVVGQLVCVTEDDPAHNGLYIKGPDNWIKMLSF